MGDLIIDSFSQAPSHSIFPHQANSSHKITHFVDTKAESLGVSRQIQSLNDSKKGASVFFDHSQSNFQATPLDASNEKAMVSGCKAILSSMNAATNPHYTDKQITSFIQSIEQKFQSQKTELSKNHQENMDAKLKAAKQQMQHLVTEIEKPVNSDSEGVGQKTKQLKISEVYFKFFKLLARIIEQAESDAYALYQAAKERTDQCDKLNALYGKLLATNGKVDWSKDEEAKKMIEEARALGVNIPDHKGTYQFSEEQKKNLLENIRNKKDSLDKLTQMEKTDLQRYMQIATNGHEWRSNMLKMWQSAASTITSNFRPH